MITRSILPIACFLLLLLLSHTTSATAEYVLEPGEIVSEVTRVAAASSASAGKGSSPLEEGPSTSVAVRCDSAMSRKARQIIQDIFTSKLPSQFQLPLTCPFHPFLDLLIHEDRQKELLPGGKWKCKVDGRIFQDQLSIDNHIQNRHMQHVASNAVCLADYCDMLDCYHRTISFDPLTGEVLSPDQGSAAYGGGSANTARKRREAAAAAASNRVGDAVSHLLKDDSSATTTGTQILHPHSSRCNSHSMELVRNKCATTLMQCLPWRGTHAYGMSAKDVHDLYDRMNKEICSTLECTSDGGYVNAASLAESRSEQSRGRLYTIFFALLMVAILVFYALIYSLRGEFGWRNTSQSGSTSLTQSDRRSDERSIMKRIKIWIGMEQKKRNNPTKLF